MPRSLLPRLEGEVLDSIPLGPIVINLPVLEGVQDQEVLIRHFRSAQQEEVFKVSLEKLLEKELA